MIIDGRFVVDTSREVTWRELADVPALVPLLPGCEAIERTGEHDYRVTAQVKVGPIKTRLGGTLHELEMSPPESMQLRIEGKDDRTGSQVRAAIGLTVAKAGEGRSEVAYSADVLITGALGMVAQAIVRETAATMLEEFVRRLHARLTGTAIQPTGLGALTMKAAARSVAGGVSSLLGRPRDPEPDHSPGRDT